jgi:hypothetical protein
MYSYVARNSQRGSNDRLAKLSAGQIMDGNLECLYIMAGNSMVLVLMSKTHRSDLHPP